MFLDLTTGEMRVIDRCKTNPIAGFDWSPDGEWVAYSVPMSLQITVLKLWKAATGEIFPLTHAVLRDGVNYGGAGSGTSPARRLA